ncbi:MAG: hypothetical protein UU13_C0001G0056 [Candidatus Nomurabacteria bacterium GW2011_GWB1_40_7]|uniref:Uncharacterized protein n=1 Tax=Candidatus Nomurabacteria bacterium GW2011_GWB1_40_7 TaxID=1618744 RepID=A0A0G0T198_9BACT|nr:MAG: hypothetical protein UU13_C0001G0056 [Candidatus Nomurabacteria bacterium GW2011_GWB1_40_7]
MEGKDKSKPRKDKKEKQEQPVLPGAIPVDLMASNMDVLRKHFANKEDNERLAAEQEQEHIKEILEKIKEKGNTP